MLLRDLGRNSILNARKNLEQRHSHVHLWLGLDHFLLRVRDRHFANDSNFQFRHADSASIICSFDEQCDSRTASAALEAREKITSFRDTSASDLKVQRVSNG
jgi:hypothetical protein